MAATNDSDRQPDEQQFVLGVDLDGVVADFYGGMRPIAAEWLGVDINTLSASPSYGLTEWNLASVGTYEDLHRFAVTQRNLFATLIPIAGAAPTLRRLSQQGVRIRIITHRLYIKYFHEEAVSQTVTWLEHHGIPYWDLCFMKDKAAAGANLYVEDSPVNIEALRGDGHETIIFENASNQGLPPPRARTWAEVSTLVLQRQAEWIAARPQRKLAGT